MSKKLLTEYVGSWAYELDGVTIDEAIDYLVKQKEALSKKPYETIKLSVEDEYSHFIVTRFETDDEYAYRLDKEARMAEVEEANSRQMWESLCNKFGKPEPRNILHFDEWSRIATPVMEPWLSIVPSEKLRAEMVHKAYDDHVKSCK